MIPNQLRAGSAYTWQEATSAPAGETYEYTLFNGGAVYTVEGTDKSFALTSAETSGWMPGVYDFVLRSVDSGSNKTDVARGTLEILPNPELSPNGLDGRSHARRVLDAIEATIEGRSSDDAVEITIRGRTIKQTPLTDLVKMRDLYRREVAAEREAARIRNGQASGRFRQVRFSA